MKTTAEATWTDADLGLFYAASDAVLSDVDGGFVPIVITAAMVAKGLAAFGGGFAIGLAIGKCF